MVPMMQPPSSPSHQVVNQSTPSPTLIPTPPGLSALHVAVIQNDRHKVRALLASNEHGVDERTTMGATALMLAGLYGRYHMFKYLSRKSASTSKQDFEGYGCLDYLKHRAFTKPLLQKYQDIAFDRPRRAGRVQIYDFLRAESPTIKQGRWERSERAQTPPVKATPGEQSERRVVFLRKGGMLQVVEIRSLAVAEWPFKLGRKTW